MPRPASTEARPTGRRPCSSSGPSCPTCRSGCSPRGPGARPSGVLLVLQGMDTSGKGGVLRHTVGLVDPQGVRITSLQGADRGGARARLPVADPRGHCPSPGTSASSTGPTTRTCSSPGSASSPSPTRSSAATTRSTSSRRAGRRRRDRRSSSACSTSRPRSRRSGCWRGSTTPTKHWKYNPGDIDERELWPAYREAYEIALERTNTEVAPWHVIPSDKKWFRNLAVGQLLLAALRGMDLAVAGRRLRRRGAASPAARARTPIRMIPTVARHPLRHAAARGRQPARDRRGRRPRHLRLQVPRRRPGAAGAGRRGRRRRAGPADRAAHAAAGRARPGPRDRPLRGRRGGPGPAQRQPRAQPRRRLPARARSASTATLPTGRRRRGQGAVAGRVLRQRRPHLAQPQPAVLARRPVGDRPRRRAVLPPRLGRRRHRPRPVRRGSRGTPPTTSSLAYAGGLAAADAEIGDLLGADGVRRGARRGARRVARAGARARRPPTPCARRTSRSWPPGSAPVSGCPRPSRPEARHDQARLPVRRPALRAARGPRGVPQRRRRALLPGRRLPRGRLERRRRPAARARPAASTWTRSGEALAFVEGVCAGDKRGGAAVGQADRHPLRLPQGPEEHRAPARPGPRRRHHRPRPPARAPPRPLVG